MLKCICEPNLEILSWTGDELSHGQAQNGVNFDFEVKFDLEGQGQSPPKTMGILTKVFDKLKLKLKHFIGQPWKAALPKYKHI